MVNIVGPPHDPVTDFGRAIVALSVPSMLVIAVWVVGVCPRTRRALPSIKCQRPLLLRGNDMTRLVEHLDRLKHDLESLSGRVIAEQRQGDALLRRQRHGRHLVVPYAAAESGWTAAQRAANG